MTFVYMALGEVLQASNLLILAASVAVGLVTGAIPGLTVNMAVALAVPLTLSMSPVASIMMLLGLYCSGVYGGSVSAILLNAPGTPASAATSLDGYPLARQGRAGLALKVAILASVVGGLFSVMLLILVAPGLAEIALRFGPVELAGLLLFSLALVALVSGADPMKAMVATGLGALMSSVGSDPMLGTPRFIFGVNDLYDGIPFIPLLIGLFAVSEMLFAAENRFRGTGAPLEMSGQREANRLGRTELRRIALPVLSSSAIGSFVGMLPGLGASVSSFLSYSVAQKTSRHADEFGKGAIEGVASAEAANNAVTGSAMIPLLALAIPGDSVTAILLGALMIQGVAPGPMIFSTAPDMVYTIYFALLLANIFIAVLALVAIRPLTQVLRIPQVYLYPVILVMCVAGSYVLRSSGWDVATMFAGGLLGYLLRRMSVPLAPLLIAFILAAPFEEASRQGLTMSRGNPMVFFSNPISLGFVLVTVALIAGSAFMNKGKVAA